MTTTKRLAELKAGDHVWFEGNICEVLSIESDGTGGSYQVKIKTVAPEDPYEEEGTWQEGDWAVPSDEDVAFEKLPLLERCRILDERRAAREARD